MDSTRVTVLGGSSFLFLVSIATSLLVHLKVGGEALGSCGIIGPVTLFIVGILGIIASFKQKQTLVKLYIVGLGCCSLYCLISNTLIFVGYLGGIRSECLKTSFRSILTCERDNRVDSILVYSFTVLVTLAIGITLSYHALKLNNHLGNVKNCCNEEEENLISMEDMSTDETPSTERLESTTSSIVES
eukprot:TRINITY_DN3853_c0_g1_i2.p1 TRINITY_DN3853_c0_g1~~TRINITY_DN3853_c0_g1_i2.p1  ORF type:complete len:188 (-),score=41.06 TRINITY_DN3853_c0_g1_i2:52-615(-)